MPLCRMHHREVHRTVKEPQWWAKIGYRSAGHRRQTLGANPPAASRRRDEVDGQIPASTSATAPRRPAAPSRDVQAKRTQLLTDPMTSLKQIEANRRNAQKSTGPTSAEGKQRASRNALRHGLTAETVIVPLEDVEDYEAFEESVAASFDPETAVERELILRLASLLWRLRRATSIETGLFRLNSVSDPGSSPRSSAHSPAMRIVQLPSTTSSDQVGSASSEHSDWPTRSRRSTDMQIVLARRFNSLQSLDGAFERVTRYETALWRQARQVLLALASLRRGASPRHRAPHASWQKFGVFNSGRLKIRRMTGPFEPVWAFLFSLPGEMLRTQRQAQMSARDGEVGRRRRSLLRRLCATIILRESGSNAEQIYSCLELST